MDDPHLFSAVKYIELNPVRAKIVTSALEYPWSSARAHARNHNDLIVSGRPKLLERIDWAKFLEIPIEQAELYRMRKCFRNGMPLGNEEFIEKLERLLGKKLRKNKPGPKSQIR